MEHETGEQQFQLDTRPEDQLGVLIAHRHPDKLAGDLSGVYWLCRPWVLGGHEHGVRIGRWCELAATSAWASGTLLEANIPVSVGADVSARLT